MQVGALFKHWSLRLLAPDLVLQNTYDNFKTLLACDGRCHALMAEFEALYHNGQREDFARTRIRHRRLTEAVVGMVSALEQMSPRAAHGLRDYVNKYDFYIHLQLAPPERFLIPPFVVDHTSLVEAGLVGNKSHRLVELQIGAQVPAPKGFTITSTTFDLLLAHNQVRPAIDLLLAAIDFSDFQGLEHISQALATMVSHLEIPSQVEQEIYAAYDALTGEEGTPARVAVRSSAQQEDGSHSFAGQYHSVLGVGRQQLLSAYLEVLASKYTSEALLYRIHAGLSDEEASMAVLVLSMVEAVAAGVVYTRDPMGGSVPSLLVQSIHGLGLPLVSGEVVPEVFTFPPEGLQPSAYCQGQQADQLVLQSGKVVRVPCVADKPTLTREQVNELAVISRRIESFYDGTPQDIEWALDSAGRIVILQARPLETDSPADRATKESAKGSCIQSPPILCGAIPASTGVASGRVHHADTLPQDGGQEKVILVTRHIAPSLVRHIHQLSAVVCEQGAVTGHFATVCREFGVVLLVSAQGALQCLQPGMEVTVDGYQGIVYEGFISEWLQGDTGHKQKKSDGYGQRIRKILDYITPLHLVNPQESNFRPQSCRSLHDIIRYAHEMAVQSMFGLGEMTGGASSRSRKLATDLPLDIYLLDVGGAFADSGKKSISPQRLHAKPFLALWQGLSHPEIDWQSHLHFDWQGFGDMALSGGIAEGDARQFGSYAVISPDYLNLNMRFGFHFTLIDCLCGTESRANHCHLRFAGGGGNSKGRAVRILLLQNILGRLGFEVQVLGDLLDARLSGWPMADLLPLLTEVGRLLGMTKLLDMVLSEEDVDQRVEQFFNSTTTNP
ncbi:MAG: PEP/pyruvate-binding domain-containing protein [Desulfobulbus sp.]|nr:PEP/pyruvate-binding domain-containing protein [Desulfobulbus sp.]